MWTFFQPGHFARLMGLTAIWLWLAIAGARGAESVPKPESIPLVDLEGHPTPPVVAATTRAVVFVFLGVECPIANRCAPELARLASRLGPRGIRFLHVYPNPDETTAAIREHRRQHGLPTEAYRDPDLRAAKALHARWTPEAVALTPEGALIYQGRVNDQFTALGVGRPQPTRHDLEEALEGFLAGTPPSAITTPRVGCTFRPAP